MPIEGPLRELGIEDVLQLLELARKTGILEVRSERENDEGQIHLDHGDIVFARRRRTRRLLGQQLLRSGRITERELDRAMELQRAEPTRRLSEILLEMGSVTEEEVREQLRFLVEESVYEVMAWQEGYFRFEEREDVFRSTIPVRVPVGSLLMEGARRIDEWTQLESRIPGLESVPILAPLKDGESPIELRPEEWEVLAEIDGDRDIGQIAAILGRSTFEVGKIVYGMVAGGVVRVRERPPRIPEKELRLRIAEAEGLLGSGRPEEAERVVAELQAAHPERPEIALLEGRSLSEQGRMRAATEAFARAVSLDPLTPAGYYHLGFAAISIGDVSRAAEAWEMYLRLAPESMERSRVARGVAAVHMLAEILTTFSERSP